MNDKSRPSLPAARKLIKAEVTREIENCTDDVLDKVFHLGRVSGMMFALRHISSGPDFSEFFEFGTALLERLNAEYHAKRKDIYG